MCIRDRAVAEMKEAIYKSYFRKRGQQVVDMNYASIEHGINELKEIQIPESWRSAEEVPVSRELPDFIRDVVVPMNRQEGNGLPLSTLMKYGLEDGTWPNGTSQYEKRGAAVEVPEWNMDRCIQCNQCALVCPHAAIRPILLTEEEAAAAPEGFAAKKASGKGLETVSYTHLPETGGFRV